jgi:histidinol-phosphate aminotransferase
MKMGLNFKKKGRIDLGNSYFKYPLPERLLNELTKELKDINLYPSGGGYIQLRKILANYVGTQVKNILPTNGSDEAIQIVTQAYKGNILIPIPTFFQYEASADRVNSSKKFVNCMHKSRYVINYSDQELKNTSLIWICNPNNPTGTEVPQDKIINILKKAQGMVILDECYYEYLGRTMINSIDKFPNLIIIRSFSKNFGLAGLRLGFAISNANNINKLNSSVQNFRVNIMAEKAAENVLKYLPYYQEAWENTKRIRDNFIKEVNKLGFDAFNSKTNFVLVDFKSEKVAEYIWRHLQKNDIYTLPGWENEFSGLSNQFIRFNIGEKWEMDKVLECLSECQSSNN